MTSVVILICHDHDRSVAKVFNVVFGVLCAHLETHDLDDVLDLLVLSNRFCRGVAHIQKLTLERKATVVVSANDFDTSHC